MKYQGNLTRVALAALILAFALPSWAEDTPTTAAAPAPGVSERVTASTDTPSAEPDATLAAPPLPSASAPSLPEPGSTTNDSDKWQFALYPILGWAPIFRANTDFSLPGGGGSGSGATNWGFNGAALFGVDVTKNGWLFEAEGMWASVSASRQNPIVNVSTDAYYGDLFVGHKLWKDISLLAGFRRMAVSATITVQSFPTFSRKPGVWDPLIGLDWRRRFGRKWFAQIRADGGGFGVGSDVDVDLEARMEWRFVKHFGLLIGYEALHYQISGTVQEVVGSVTLQHPWQLRQTFNGPLMGFGIYF
jgi:hypothetical protein